MSEIPIIGANNVDISTGMMTRIDSTLKPNAVHPAAPLASSWLTDLISSRLSVARATIGEEFARQLEGEIKHALDCTGFAPGQPLPMLLEVLLGLDDRMTPFDYGMANDNVDAVAVVTATAAEVRPLMESRIAPM